VTTTPAVSVGHIGVLRATLNFLRDPFAALERARENGELVHTRVLGWRAVLVTSPALAHEVLTGAGDVWHKDRLTRRTSGVFGEGLLLAEGEVWRRQRSMLNPGFRHARYEAYAAVMLEEAEATLAGWTDGRRIDLAAEMAAVTLRIAVRTLFGRGLPDPRVTAVGRAFAEISEFLASALANSPLPLPRWLPLPMFQRYRAAITRLDGVVAEVIAARRRDGAGGDDLLAMLLEARDEQGSGLGDREVRDQVMTFLLAGHETTALLLISALVLLGMHPRERARVEAEVDALGRAPGVTDPLPRIDAVIAESLRLRPPAWAMSREPTRDIVLGGHRIAAGTIVVVSPWALHHDPRSWGPDVMSFRPDRFADASSPPKGAYFPFGLGGRKCIGARFAEMEARLLLARWAQAVRLDPEPAVLPKLVPSITARPAGPVWARVRVRRGA
jgi:cytochrome P450